MIEFFITPFVEYPFMLRALFASIMVAISSGVVGVFLVMRRMSLVGDALSHGILPGIALGFLFYGFNLIAMEIGGVIAGILIAIFAFTVSRFTKFSEDASFAAFYLISLASGVIIISKIGSNTDLTHILFGSVLAIDRNMLFFIFGVLSFTLIVLALIYRVLILFIIDPLFLKSQRMTSIPAYSLFLFVVVVNLIAGFQALGSLMAVGLLMLPAIISQFWTKSMEGAFVLVLWVGVLVSYFGLLVSFYYTLPSGPSIIAVAGVFYFLSLLFGRFESVFAKLYQLRHKAA